MAHIGLHSAMKHFVPLECNPDVFNGLAANFGVKNVEFVDIFSLDEDMLAFIPRPVLAVLLVFPVSESYEKYRNQADSNVQEHTDSQEVQWYKQTIGNACGTMAFLHATNGIDPSNISDPMARILAETKNLDTFSRAQYLENSKDFESVHHSVAQTGDTSAPNAEDNVEFHYVCLTKDSKGRLVELDGRRKGPIVRAEEINDLLDAPSIEVINEFLSREGDGAFSMVAMCGV